MTQRLNKLTAIILLGLSGVACPSRSSANLSPIAASPEGTKSTLLEIDNPDIKKVLTSAHEQVKLMRGYSQGYVTMSYPGGDLPLETGACTDVIVRAFRSAGVDLQKEVHEDMLQDFSAYPKKWGLPGPDTNIDHRRVPNLQTFFSRRGKALAVSNTTNDYRPGDVVSWDLDGKGMTHIGLVSDVWSDRTRRYLIIHNIGGGTNLEDRLFDWKVTGHFRYF